jgi:hypothetical protein
MEKRIKTGGRAKGVVNKTTAEMKEFLKTIVTYELTHIALLLQELTPRDKIDAIIKLLPYVVPKQSEILIEPGELKQFTPIEITIVR